MDTVKRKGLSPSRLQHHRSALRTFFAFAGKMKVIKVIYFTFGLILIILFNSFSAPLFTIHENGYGPIAIGMTIPEASKALGVELKYPQDIDIKNEPCYYVYPNGKPDLIGFMIEKSIITRVDVSSKGYYTDSGIQIGDKEAEIFKKYPQKKISEKIHPYLGKDGKYIMINTSEKNRIIFETEQGTIISFRVGIIPSVDYIEGCL